MSEYLTFDGEWSRVRLSSEGVETLEAIMRQENRVRCGHWRLYLSNAPFSHTLNGHYWPYVVSIEAPHVDASFGPVLFETVLVSGFVALLQLFTLLKAGDIISDERAAE